VIGRRGCKELGGQGLLCGLFRHGAELVLQTLGERCEVRPSNDSCRTFDRMEDARQFRARDRLRVTRRQQRGQRGHVIQVLLQFLSEDGRQLISPAGIFAVRRPGVGVWPIGTRATPRHASPQGAHCQAPTLRPCLASRWGNSITSAPVDTAGGSLSAGR